MTQQQSEEIYNMNRLSQNPANPSREAGWSVWINDYQVTANERQNTMHSNRLTEM